MNMNPVPHTTNFDMTNVLEISRGEKERALRYLNQFTELTVQRLVQLDEVVRDQDRNNIRRILHSMRPQIQFFGVKNVVPDIERLELEYTSIPWEELKSMTDGIKHRLELAVKEVVSIVDKYYSE